MTHTGIAQIRELAGLWAVRAQIAFPPLVLATALTQGNPWVGPVLVSIALGAFIAGFAWWFGRGAPATQYAVTIVLMTQISLLVLEAAGPWQIDFHMIYFAGLAVLLAFCNWKVILLGAVTIVLHHLLLNFIMPYGVFPDGADLRRVLFHGGVVAIEAIVLIPLAYQIVTLFDTASDAQRAAEESAQKAATLLDQQEDAAKARARQQRDMERLLESFNAFVVSVLAELNESATGMTRIADSMSGTAEENSDRSAAAAQISSQATINVQAVAGAAEELAVSLRHVRTQVDESARIAAEATEEAYTSNTKIEELRNAAEAIGVVINLITEIAEQTNLLALNATIEAARAGEAGKGFAVVAAEVKSLALQTAKATRDIGSQVETIQKEVGDAVAAIERVTGIIERMNEISGSVRDVVREQDTATAEIARNVQDAAQGTVSASENMEEVRGAAQKTGTEASHVRDAASRIAGRAQELREDVASFRKAIQRAAELNLFESMGTDHPAVLHGKDTQHAGRVTAISALGAQFSGNLTDAKERRWDLAIDGVDHAIPCEIQETGTNGTVLRFDPRTVHLDALIAFASTLSKAA